jgi:hypothetical protein
MSSAFVQVTVAPTGTVIDCGPKTKLSIFTVAFATAGWSFALTLGETANNSSIPISTGIATPATHILFLVIVLIPFYVDVRALFFFYGSLVSF